MGRNTKIERRFLRENTIVEGGEQYINKSEGKKFNKCLDA